MQLDSTEIEARRARTGKPRRRSAIAGSNDRVSKLMTSLRARRRTAWRRRTLARDSAGDAQPRRGAVVLWDENQPSGK
jgi:hypothetical protein